MVYANVAEILGVGMPELLIILVIILLIVGGKKLPELAHSVGQAAKELRKGMNGDLDDEPTKQKAESKNTDQQA